MFYAYSYKEATELHPKSAVAWHNFAVAENARKHLKVSRESARRAMDLAVPEEAIYF